MEFKLKHDNHPALLILDVQELFSSAEEPFENPQAGTLIGQINNLITETRDLSIPVIFSRYAFRDDLSDAGLLRDNPIVRQGYFGESAESMKPDVRLKLPEECTHLTRNRPGAFWGGKLLEHLQATGINTLILCGLSVNNAISTTAREAFAHDIPVLIPEECTGAAPWETHNEIYFEILDTWTAEVGDLNSIVTRFANLR